MRKRCQARPRAVPGTRGSWCLARAACLAPLYRAAATIASAMADERELSLQEQLEGIGAQLDWVRGYL
jgi:hypothetical protein